MTTANTLAALVNSSSQVVVPSGGINFGTSTDGTGTATSGVMDDYEEGTWTPTVTLTVGASMGNNSTQVGKYTKTGNVVNFQAYVDTSAWTHSGTVHRFLLTNLPFYPSTSPTQYAMFTARLNHGNTTGQHLTGALATNVFSDSIYFNVQDSSGNSANIIGNNVPSGTNLIVWISGSYMVA